MVLRSNTLSDHDIQSAALLKIQHATMNIMAGMHPGMDDIHVPWETRNRRKLIEYSNDFSMIVSLTRSVMSAMEKQAKDGNIPFSFSSDVNLIGPLYYVCINCLDVSVRKAAMDLLLRYPRREGMWNSTMIAQMIRDYWNLEAGYMSTQGSEATNMSHITDFSDHGSVHFAYFGKTPEMDDAVILS